MSEILLMEEILLFTRFYTSQVVQDFFHQQYVEVNSTNTLGVLGYDFWWHSPTELKIDDD